MLNNYTNNDLSANDLKDVFSASKWMQPSIDEESYLPSSRKIVNEVYSVTPDEELVISIESDQSWFWTDKWQAGERAAQADIDAGRIRHFSNIDDAIAALGLEEDAGD